MIYCDSSFLVALYVKRDAFHLLAAKTATRFQEPIPYTLLAELELINGVRRNLAAKHITSSEGDAIFRQISQDEFDEILVRLPLHQTDHYGRARDLSKKFTPELASRSLDILHVAAALLLRATAFASFDAKQRILAERAGLKMAPKVITNRS